MNVKSLPGKEENRLAIVCCFWGWSEASLLSGPCRDPGEGSGVYGGPGVLRPYTNDNELHHLASIAVSH